MINRKYELMSWERGTAPEDERLSAARAALKGNVKDPLLWMELGHSYAKLNMMREAADCYSMSISIDPFNWEFYRHRAHGFISCLHFEDAAADFTLATRLNPKDFSCWYYLGLSWYLLGNYARAMEAYIRCFDTIKQEDSPYSLTAWAWLTFSRQGKKEEAVKLLEKIPEDIKPKENAAYYYLCLMYKGVKTPEQVLASLEPAFEKVTAGYGISAWYDIQGDRKKSDEEIEEVLKTGDANGYSYALGCLASMADKRRRAGL
jgi:tetratricopeptide (TPR) repeat protein